MKRVRPEPGSLASLRCEWSTPYIDNSSRRVVVLSTTPSSRRDVPACRPAPPKGRRRRDDTIPSECGIPAATPPRRRRSRDPQPSPSDHSYRARTRARGLAKASQPPLSRAHRHHSRPLSQRAPHPHRTRGGRDRRPLAFPAGRRARVRRPRAPIANRPPTHRPTSLRSRQINDRSEFWVKRASHPSGHATKPESPPVCSSKPRTGAPSSRSRGARGSAPVGLGAEPTTQKDVYAR
jgi:hypothetical protein